MSDLSSQRIAQELGVTLSPDVIEWYDRFQDIEFGPYWGDFSESGDIAKQILNPNSSVICAGLMPPDTLPILDNGFGDALLLRFGAQGELIEVIRWNHEGDAWRPYGRTLAEAMLCDIAIVKATTGPLDSECEYADRPIEQWAVQQVERARGSALNWEQACQGDEFSLLDCLLNAGHCEVAAHYEYCRDALSCELTRQRHGPLGELADRLGVPWPTFWPWMFDTRTMPSPVRSRLADMLACPVEPLLLQDWDRVRVGAQRAQFLRPDLGWTHALLGYAAERAGDFPTALAQYQAGLGTLGRGAELNAFVCGNFAAQRLHGLRAHWPADLVRHEYLQTALGRDGTGNRPGDLRAYWMGVAGQAESSGDYARAYQSYYAAGWDQLVYDDMDQVLQGLVRTSEGAGFRALHRIAQLHLRCLEETTRCIPQLPMKSTARGRVRALFARLFR